MINGEWLRVDDKVPTTVSFTEILICGFLSAGASLVA